MAGIQTLIIGILLTSLFAIAIFSFAINYQSENTINPIGQNVTQDSEFNIIYKNLSDNLLASQDKIQAQADAYYADKPDTTLLFLIMNTIITVPNTLANMVSLMFNILTAYLFPQIFGQTFKIVSGVILAILGVAIVLALMKFVRTGAEK